MNLLQIISDLKQIAAECKKVTSGNISHRIANIEHGILNIADCLENYCPLGWHPASELPPVDKETGFKELQKQIAKQDSLAQDIRDWVVSKCSTYPDYYNNEVIAAALGQVAKEYGYEEE